MGKTTESKNTKSKNTRKTKKSSPVKVSSSVKIQEYIVNTRNNLAKQNKKREMSYIFNKKDDNTIDNHKNQCMCIDYDFDNNGKYTLSNNPNQDRCKNKTHNGRSFCDKHKNCHQFLRMASVTGYEPGQADWKHPYVEGSHNCYSYFVDDINKEIVSLCEKDCIKKNKKGCPKKISECGDYKPQQGNHHRLTTQSTLKGKERVYQCPNMEQKIMNDNPAIVKSTFLDKCPPWHYKGAMVVDPDHTFHFYRQNKDGTWSHKPGTLPVTDKDADNNRIYVPHFSNRNYSKDKNNNDDPINYTDFCGYYCIPNNKHSDTHVI